MLFLCAAGLQSAVFSIFSEEEGGELLLKLCLVCSVVQPRCIHSAAALSVITVTNSAR